MAKTLFAVDELSGFIVACAYVRPEGIHGMTPKSVKKKLKTAVLRRRGQPRRGPRGRRGAGRRLRRARRVRDRRARGARRRARAARQARRARPCLSPCARCERYARVLARAARARAAARRDVPRGCRSGSTAWRSSCSCASTPAPTRRRAPSRRRSARRSGSSSPLLGRLIDRRGQRAVVVPLALAHAAALVAPGRARRWPARRPCLLVALAAAAGAVHPAAGRRSCARCGRACSQRGPGAADDRVRDGRAC